MRILNNKGYTLIEILAVVAILGMVIAIMIPNVTKLIDRNEQNNKEQLNKSIISAAKLYITDYKYKITLDTTSGICSNTITTLNIKSIDDSNEELNTLTNSQIKISTLIEEGNLKTDKEGNIYNPMNKTQKLKLNESYITIKYDCQTKDYIYEEKDVSGNYTNLKLNWE